MSTNEMNQNDRDPCHGEEALVVFVLAVLAVFYGCQANPPRIAESVAPESAAVAPAASRVTITCGNSQKPISINPAMPHLPDFAGFHITNPDPLQELQCDFDVFSWNSFIALNHSADGSLGGNHPTIWEDWPESSDIFLDGGADPGAWPGRPHVPSACANTGQAPVFSQLGKRPLLEATGEPFDSGPLVDANGWYTRFTISINRQMYDVIHDHQLYSQQGQRAYSLAGRRVAFPCGCNADGSGQKCSPAGQVGAVMVKAAWKVLTPGDDRATFHTVDGLVYTPPHGGHGETCTSRTMGLVGFHIGHKTQTEPQWVWSTFEHVNNVPTRHETIPSGASFNYYIPGCTDCNTDNSPPPRPWSPHDEPVTANSRKSQIVRENAIVPATQTINIQARALLRSVPGAAVWANYELISTQWPTNGPQPGSPLTAPLWCHALNGTDNSGVPAPEILANSTLETYIQSSSSCIDCHREAAMAAGQNNFSDFTYLLELAK